MGRAVRKWKAQKSELFTKMPVHGIIKARSQYLVEAYLALGAEEN